MARNPLQDRVKTQRDPVFINKKFTVIIPTLEVTHFVGKRILKHCRQETPGRLDSNNNLRDRKMCLFTICAIHFKILCVIAIH